MSSGAFAADVVGAASLWPGAPPGSWQPPAAVSAQPWPAHVLPTAPGIGLFPSGMLRRLGRAQAMALSVAKLAATECVVPNPGGASVAVTVGTAWSESGDEAKFLRTLIELGEKGARPALFVNAVHNALASRVAMEFGWQGENHTFTHDALSFETALWQGERLLRRRRAELAVVCGVDALTEVQAVPGKLLGRYRTEGAGVEPMSGSGAPLPGEGAAAFVLVAPGWAPRRLAHLAAVRIAGPEQRDRIDPVAQFEFVRRAIEESGAPKPGVLILGANGEPRVDDVCREMPTRLADVMEPGCAVGVYRHCTGDFETASALALSLAVQLVGGVPAPQLRILGPAPTRPPACVLLYHLSALGYHSAMIVTR